MHRIAVLFRRNLEERRSLYMPFDNCHFRNNSKYGCPAEFGAVFMGFVCAKYGHVSRFTSHRIGKIAFASRKELLC